AENLLAAVGLEQRAKHLPAELSGGERQRVAVARALMNKPALVLADEPSGNLDEQNSDRLNKLFLDLNQSLGQTFLIVTHDRRLASLASRCVQMHSGQISLQ
ncbi:MAG TPA: ATP-binding cassette domain-containing protein, partial [Fibrobacteraceae bacterium]|nr:ATP-binding cassette domain-containing protein [Fibrobacteraceae bacterium]